MDRLFLLISVHYQWIMAFLLPAAREIVENCYLKFLPRASRDDTSTAECVIKIENALFYEFYVAIRLVTTATDLKMWMIFVIDFVFSLSLYVSLKKNRNFRRVDASNTVVINIDAKEDKLLTQFVLGKASEIMCPIVFMLTLTMAYYGPNNPILLTIGCSYFDSNTIEDLTNVIINEMTMFAGILIQAMLSCVLVWIICRKKYLPGIL